jgi:L-fucose mutarotase
MLKGIDPILNADVLFALRSMGHGDDLIICDTNFPAQSVADATVSGVLLRIDRPIAVDDAAARMEVVGEPDTILPVMKEVQAELAATGHPDPMMPIERYAFYDRAKKAYAVIQTGERRFYGCFALRKGVIGPEA